jgi:hypothetical protein
MQFIASYTRQFHHLAGTWQPNDPASFIQPNAFQNDRGIGSVWSNPGGATDANALSGTSETRAQQWRDHELRVGGSWNAPWNVLVATNYMFESGHWSGPIILRVPTPDPRFGAPTVLLPNGRLVSNPLATTFRFGYPTRGDGQFTSDAVHIWNVRVGRRLTFQKHVLEGDLDFYNVVNGAADQLLLSGANQTFNSSFGQGSQRQLPRSAQFTIRFTF